MDLPLFKGGNDAGSISSTGCHPWEAVVLTFELAQLTMDCVWSPSSGIYPTDKPAYVQNGIYTVIDCSVVSNGQE